MKLCAGMQAFSLEALLLKLYPTNSHAVELVISGLRKYKEYFPSYATLAKNLDISVRHAKRIFRYLKEIGLIYIVSRGGKGLKSLTNKYMLNKHLFKSFLKHRLIAAKQSACRERIQNVTLSNDLGLYKNINNNLSVHKQPLCTPEVSQPTKIIDNLPKSDLSEEKKRELLDRQAKARERYHEQFRC